MDGLSLPSMLGSMTPSEAPERPSPVTQSWLRYQLVELLEVWPPSSGEILCFKSEMKPWKLLVLAMPAALTQVDCLELPVTLDFIVMPTLLMQLSRPASQLLVPKLGLGHSVEPLRRAQGPPVELDRRFSY